jgi:cellulose synthase (UDP-forming)
MLLTATVGVSAVDYFAWRWGVINWASWWVALPLFIAEFFGALHTLGLQYTVWPRRETPLVIREDPTSAPVFIFVPTVNEGVAILEPTLRGAIAARDRYVAAYPHARVTIVICNDGRVAKAPNWQETEALAQRLGVTCITRETGGGAKAGNIEHARQQLDATGNAQLVLFDADQIAEPDFLLKTAPPFADPAIGWVQTGQYYRNRDNPVARWADDQQAIFYCILCPGKARQNAAFICGINVMLRAAALDEIGGLPRNSVTEDFAASIALHPRWRGIFLSDVLAMGLGPMDLTSYFKQQGRWATGTLGVLRSHWRAIFLPRRDGLQFGQRLQYALACTHYLCGVRDLTYIIAPWSSW